MKPSRWSGRSGKAREQNESGWRDSASRSRKTWNWPSLSARQRCPTPDHLPLRSTLLYTTATIVCVRDGPRWNTCKTVKPLSFCVHVQEGGLWFVNQLIHFTCTALTSQMDYIVYLKCICLCKCASTEPWTFEDRYWSLQIIISTGWEKRDRETAKKVAFRFQVGSNQKLELPTLHSLPWALEQGT